VRHAQPGYEHARPWFGALWLANIRYALRGRIDGRRGMPTVSGTGAQRTPSLHRLADEVAIDVQRVHAEGLARTSDERVELAELTVTGGRRTRAEQRLSTVVARLEEIESADPLTGRRFGEEHLPEELVSSRRRREHARRVKQARKRVEDERTALSELLSRQGFLEASIDDELSHAEARAQLAGGVHRSKATSYLNGALRKHPDRPLLSALTPQLMPWPPSSSGTIEREDRP